MDAEWGRGVGRHDLNELDRLLSMLARPSRLGAGVPWMVRQELRGLGIRMGQAAGREELIEQIWSLKRPLLRQLGTRDDPLPPCA
jgi:hypothetical protein